MNVIVVVLLFGVPGQWAFEERFDAISNLLGLGSLGNEVELVEFRVYDDDWNGYFSID